MLQLFVITTYSQLIQGLDNVRLFTITAANGDTIHFIKSNADLEKKKPTILFCQGSLPKPLIITNESQGPFIASYNFNYSKLCDKYNLIEISMPHTPPILPWKMLNKDGCFSTNKDILNHFDSLYLKNNYLENYVYRANSVLSFLKKQKWVDTNKIAVFGHSQGSYIAIEIARTNKLIKVIGYSGGNPMGRFEIYIRQIRRDIISKKISEEEGQTQIDKTYLEWKNICKEEESKIEGADRCVTWKSFSKNFLNEITDLKIPIYITYGTNDLESCESSELLPIYFQLKGKTNYKMMPFVGCGHNFEEVSADGKHNWEKMYWDKAIDGFIDYWESLGK